MFDQLQGKTAYWNWFSVTVQFGFEFIQKTFVAHCSLDGRKSVSVNGVLTVLAPRQGCTSSKLEPSYLLCLFEHESSTPA